MKKIISLVMVTMFTLGGCATLMNDKYARVSVLSEPKGTPVYLDNEKVGETPASVKVLQKKKEQTIKVGEVEHKIESKMKGKWLAADLTFDLLLFPIASIIDLCTKRWREIPKEQLIIK